MTENRKKKGRKKEKKKETKKQRKKQRRKQRKKERKKEGKAMRNKRAQADNKMRPPGGFSLVVLVTGIRTYGRTNPYIGDASKKRKKKKKSQKESNKDKKGEIEKER